MAVHLFFAPDYKKLKMIFFLRQSAKFLLSVLLSRYKWKTKAKSWEKLKNGWNLYKSLRELHDKLQNKIYPPVKIERSHEYYGEHSVNIEFWRC